MHTCSSALRTSSGMRPSSATAALCAPLPVPSANSRSSRAAFPAAAGSVAGENHSQLADCARSQGPPDTSHRARSASWLKRMPSGTANNAGV